MKTSNVKRILCGCLLFAATWPAFGQPATNPRLIIRADDMGSFRSANIACMEGYKNGVETCIEVMVVTSWFPEAARLLRENPGIDVGLHLTFTSEWDNVKWRPLTHCPSLTDSNGYFLPMMSPNPAYPGLAILENTWSLAEIEQEARAQIEMALKNIPQISHISGHMGSTGFDPEVVKLMRRLSEEYHLPVVDRVEAMQEYDFTYSGYDGASKTPAEKEASFIRMLDKLEPGKRYMFLDHPALDNEEMKTVGHIGYENVAMDRQGVTDLFTSPKIKQALKDKNIDLISYNDLTKELPRAEASKALDKAFGNYLRAVKKADQDLHSIMILQHGKVVKEQWLGEGDRHTPHILNSVSKTFTATAIGFAVAEGKLKVTDKVISFFPDQLPAEVSPYLKELEIRHLLTMSSGHDVDPTALVRQEGNEKADWVKIFLSAPLVHKPGTYFVYNSLGALAGMIELEPKTAEEYLVKFSRVYGYLLRHIEIDYIDISEAADFVAVYVDMLNKRYHGNIILQNEINAETDQGFILALSLQLLIENAVKHNYPQEDQKLYIRIYVRDKMLVVRNNRIYNGCRNDQNVESYGIGIRNLCRRYELECGTQPEFQATTDAFEARLPVLPKKQDI